MGQSKDGGYIKKDTLLPEQMSFLQNILQQYAPYAQQAAEGYAQFLPGGGGGEAIQQAAQKQYQQQTIPSILQAFGQGSKGGTSLNQALASSGADLNTNLGSILSQLQLQAAQGLGNMATSGQQTALQTPGFSYLQRQMPFWQQATLAGLTAAGEGARGWAGVK